MLRGSTSEPDREVMRAIAATRDLASIVDDTLHMLVRQARLNGHTWAEIGELLGVTRQAAFQRFGTPPKEADMQALEGAAEKALPVLEDFINERFADVRTRFDEVMLAACPVEMLVASYDQTYAELGGEFSAFGEPSISLHQGHTVVDVPVTFERGTRTGRVALNGDGMVSRFFLLARDR